MKHGLAPYFEEQLKDNISGVLFTFKSDETNKELGETILKKDMQKKRSTS